MSVNPATDPAGAAAVTEARASARAGRRAFAASAVSQFVRVMRDAMSQYLTARAQHVDREDCIRGLEMELRAAWPKSVSKFRPACDACDDTGFIDRVCADQLRCGREVCAKNPERQHTYVEFCHCAKGDMKRPRERTTENDQLAAVGRSMRKKRGFARVGR